MKEGGTRRRKCRWKCKRRGSTRRPNVVLFYLFFSRFFFSGLWCIHEKYSPFPPSKPARENQDCCLSRKIKKQNLPFSPFVLYLLPLSSLSNMMERKKTKKWGANHKGGCTELMGIVCRKSVYKLRRWNKKKRSKSWETTKHAPRKMRSSSFLRAIATYSLLWLVFGQSVKRQRHSRVGRCNTLGGLMQWIDDPVGVEGRPSSIVCCSMTPRIN